MKGFKVVVNNEFQKIRVLLEQLCSCADSENDMPINCDNSCERTKLKELSKKARFSKNDYITISNILRSEYKEMVFNFAKKKNIYDNNMGFQDLMFIIPEECPSLEGCIACISYLLYSEDISLYENVESMLGCYVDIKKRLLEY